MSIQTLEAQAVARDAEQAWKGHKANCRRCGSTVKGVGKEPRCALGAELAAEATTLRAAARRSADKSPSPNDVPLFDIPS